MPSLTAMPEFDSALRALTTALAVGLLIGLERGWRQREGADGSRVSGFRTFGLLGLAGGIAGLLPVALAAVLATATAGGLVVGYAAAIRRQPSLSITTTIAGLVTFALGFLAARGMTTLALAGAATTLVLLASRTPLHAMLKGLTEEEVESVARFAIVALVILPLLPDGDYGPYGALNPHRIWMVVVVVLALSFVGYAAARRFGSERTTLVMALTGALVSSTAVTATYARQLRAGQGDAATLTAGITLASLVMFVRVQIVTAMLAPFASASLAVAMVPALVVALALSAVTLRTRGGEGVSDQVKLGNPLDFGPALLLAGLVAVLSIVARWAQAHYGHHGIAALLGITGMLDVDAAVLTLSGLPRGMIDGWTAGVVLAIPILANTAIKGVMALVIAGGRRGLVASMPLFLEVLASVAGILLAGAL